MTVLLISSDAIDHQMAGPGIRYWELARQLSKSHKVILLAPNASPLSHPRFQILQHTKRVLSDVLKQAEVIITQGYLYSIETLLSIKAPLVVDLYDPLPVELLEHHAHLPLSKAQLSHSYCVERTKFLLQRGDFFLYSHERQREYWLGMLTSSGRVNHHHYREDPTFSRLLGCVPYGISETPPEHTRTVLKGENMSFSENDTVVLWGGGLWKWFDPCSIIRAMGEIAQTRQDIKLWFMATKRLQHDTVDLNIAYATEEAIALSRELGLENRTVFFNTSWIPYVERQNYLLEADIGISTHFETLETEFSFRTRILDYLWAELPIITTRGDFLSDLVEKQALGIVVAPTAVHEIREAILRFADDQQFSEQCRKNIRRVRQQFLWSRIIKPLEAFCSSPYKTSHLSPYTRWTKHFMFYAATGRLLIKYRGYKKFLRKIQQRWITRTQKN